MPAKPKSPQVARGVRNHNPGNLRRSKDPWQGLADAQTDTEFFVFKEAKWGIRALARTLITYQDRYKLDTIRLIIGRWAPPNENDTLAYVSSVADKTLIAPDDKIDVHDYETLRALIEAIIAHECSNHRYPDAVMDAGLVAAGVEPPAKPLGQSRTVRGAKAATVGTIAGSTVQAAEALEQVRVAIEPVQDLWPWIKVACVALTLAGIAMVVWARIDDRQKGLR